jgi:Ca2+-binding RTX toxin-like protein
LANGLVTLSATATTTDGDNDTATATVSADLGGNISFDDDAPASLTPTAIHMIDLATSPAITENLHFATGADGVQTVNFTIVDGAPAIDDSTGNQLAFNGQKLYLHYGQTNGEIDYTILVATTSAALAPNGVSTAGANVAYWIDINPDPSSGTGGSYTMHSNGIISNGSETTATNLSSVGGGNVVAKAISNIGGTTEDVLLTTKAGLTVNTNSSAIGIGAGQSFNGTDGIRFDFTNGTVSGNGGSAVYTADGTHNLTTSFKQAISLTAGASHADITIKAISAELADDGIYYGDGSGEGSVSITGVRVYSGTLAQVQAGTATEIMDGQNVNGIILDYTINPDGTVNIVGLQSGWVFAIETTNSFSALQIDSLSSTGNYKLGVFSYGESSAGDPVDLSYGIVGVDGDGDTVTGTIEATLYPAGATKSGLNDETPDDTLTGNDNVNYLLGNLGNDILSGLGGDDVLVGGAGTDTLTGGLGADRFVLTNGDGPDLITDFSVVQGDILDISDVLAGAEITAAEFALSPGSFLSFVQSGDDTNVVLDLDGVVGGATQVIATLQDTPVASLDIATLIGSGQIDYTP